MLQLAVLIKVVGWSVRASKRNHYNVHDNSNVHKSGWANAHKLGDVQTNNVRLDLVAGTIISMRI